MKFGVTDYILKPVDIAECQSLLASICREIDKERNDAWVKKIIDIIKGEPPNCDGWPFGLNILLFDCDLPLFDTAVPALEENGFALFNNAFKVVVNEYQMLVFTDLSYQDSVLLAKEFIQSWQAREQQRIHIVLGGVLLDFQNFRELYDKMERLLEYKFYSQGSRIYSVFDTPGDNKNDDDYLYRINIILDTMDINVSNAIYELNLMFNDLSRSNSQSVIYTKYLCSELIRVALERWNGSNRQIFQYYLERIYIAKSFENIRTLCEAFLRQHCAELPGDNSENYNRKHIENVIDYIRTHYRERISLESAAEQVYLSPSYLCNLFKKYTGQSFIKYLTSYRMEQARRLLSTTGIKINEICEMIGYNDVSYFCSIFKNHYGMTPTQYRRVQNV